MITIAPFRPIAIKSEDGIDFVLAKKRSSGEIKGQVVVDPGIRLHLLCRIV